MSAELRARVEARLSGRRKPPGRALPPVLISGLRFGAVILILTLATVLILGRRQYQRSVDEGRKQLLERVRTHADALNDQDRLLPDRIEAWLAREAGAYGGDRVDASLRTPGSFAKLLKRPAIYVRGEILDFTNPVASRAAALDSKKDPFLLCLVDPPRERNEKAQMKKVFAAYAGGARIEAPTSNVRRMADLHLGMTLLGEKWRGEIEAAKSEDELQRLRQAFAQAPVEEAKRAAKARLLVFAMDEAPIGDRPAELDGERPHPVRVGIVDLASDKLLLRHRRTVDPSWISQARRADYARGLDGCALALDVHAAVEPPTP